MSPSISETERFKAYVDQLKAELRRLGADRERIEQVMAEVWAHDAQSAAGDLVTVLGSPEQFARDVVAGRRPLRDRYLFQLRMELEARKVPAARIAEVLAEVDIHTSDSAQDPTAAFGPPKAYADQIAAEVGEARPPARPSLADLVLSGFVRLAGTLLTAAGTVALLDRESASLTLGMLLVAVAFPLASVPLSTRLYSTLLRSPSGCLAVLVMPLAGLLAQVAVLVWFRQPVLGTFPAWILVAVGLVLVAAGLAVSRRRPSPSEPVVDPRPGPQAKGGSYWDDEEDGSRSTPRGGVAGMTVLEIVILVAVVLLLR